MCASGPAGCNDETFEFEVEDTGIGIPLDEQATIFEKFRQGHTLPGQTAVTREYGGTGLGLSIVKELSKLLRRRGLTRERIRKGSTFSVRLPIGATNAPPRGESASANVGLNRATHKLLGSEPLSSEPAAIGDSAATRRPSKRGRTKRPRSLASRLWLNPLKKILHGISVLSRAT